MNTFSKTLAALALLGLASGCASTMVGQAQAISGSKGDGTVKIAAIYTGSGKMNYDDMLTDANRNQASQRCFAWGYTDAEPFGGFEAKCVLSVWDLLVGRVCVQTQATVTYQCTGGGK